MPILDWLTSLLPSKPEAMPLDEYRQYWQSTADAKSTSDHLRPPFPTPVASIQPATRGMVQPLQQGYDQLPTPLQRLFQTLQPPITVVAPERR